MIGAVLKRAIGGEASQTPESRAAAMRAGDAPGALAIARKPLPATWPEDVRRAWSARRSIVRMAAGVGEGGE